jgi:hypothetical protein
MTNLVPPAVHAQLNSLQCTLQALALAVSKSVSAVSKITSGPLPEQPLASKSNRRRARRQATARKLYAVSCRDKTAVQDVGIQTSVAESVTVICLSDSIPVEADAVQDLEVSSTDFTSSPIPVALSDKDVAIMVWDLAGVQLSTYDCSRSALCSRIMVRLQTEFKFLQEHLQHDVQQTHQLVSDMRLCDKALVSARTPVVSQPAFSPSTPETLVASEDVGDGIDKAVLGADGTAFCVVDDVWIPAYSVDDSDAMGNLVASVKDEGPAGKYAKLAADLQQQVHLAASQTVSVSNVPAVLPPLHQSGQECKQQ